MGLLENSLGAVFGRGENDGPSFGAGAYAPLATALIGLLAAKAATGGFGNLGSMFGGGSQQAPQQTGQPAPQGQENYHEASGGLLGGLGGLLHHFQQNGQADVAQSWVGAGPNQPTNSGQVQQALGPDLIRELAQRTGLSESEVSSKLSQELPALVDKLTPQGRVPTQAEASNFLNGSNPLRGY